METTPAAPTLVILNPLANRGAMARFRHLIHQHIQGTDTEYFESPHLAEAKARAHVAAKHGQPIVIAGGDGTINEIVGAVLASAALVPLGLIPAGSGNDYAWNTLKLPKDPEAAVIRAFTGDLTRVDAGQMNGRFFVNSFSIGLDADITVQAERLKRYPLMSGSRLYYASTLRQLFFGYGRCPWLSVMFDGEVVAPEEFRRYVLVAITNGPTYGGGFRINPQADHTDGAFDTCAIRHMPLPRALRLLPVVRRGEHAGQPEIAFRRAQSVRVVARATVNAQMDGETLEGTIFEARALPGALLVRV